MKISIDKSILVNALDIVAKAAPGRTTLPILEGVLLTAENGKLSLECNNLETAIKYSAECEVLKPGSTVVNAKLFSAIVKSMPDEEIDLKVDGNSMTIEAGKAVMKVAVMDSKGFPAMPITGDGPSFTIDQKVFREAIDGVAFSAGEDENKPILQCVCLAVRNGMAEIAAIDGFRMAVRNFKLNSEDMKLLIPAKKIEPVAKVIGNSGEITVKALKGNVVLQNETVQISTRLTDGEFINYKNIIPSEFETTARVNVGDLQEVMERALLINFEGDGRARRLLPAVLKISDEGIKLTLKCETGAIDDMVSAKVTGKDLDIAFNPQFILESMKHIEDKEVVLKLTTEIGPMVITPVDGDKYLHMIVPVKVAKQA